MKIGPAVVLSAVILTVSLQSQAGFADSAAPNRPVNIYSANKAYYVEMVPAKDKWGYSSFGTGTVREASGSKPLWSIDVYSAQARLTNDGKRLVVFGPWASDTSELAIAFYEEGRLLKSYMVKDLVRDESKLVRTVSHFFWITKEGGLSPDESQYALTVAGDIAYIFSTGTGEILDTRAAIDRDGGF